MQQFFPYIIVFIGIASIVFCKYKIYRIKKKYTKNQKNYFNLDFRDFDNEDISEIQFWRRFAFATPIILFFGALIFTIIQKILNY